METFVNFIKFTEVQLTTFQTYKLIKDNEFI